ncbi:MAG: hypothetical protein JNK26_05030 [Candidatus Doudnabacteria bacterium]|nr:hypothetical protein [Candidatus Doudnabacteria bacterium]
MNPEVLTRDNLKEVFNKYFLDPVVINELWLIRELDEPVLLSHILQTMYHLIGREASYREDPERLLFFALAIARELKECPEMPRLSSRFKAIVFGYFLHPLFSNVCTKGFMETGLVINSATDCGGKQQPSVLFTES